MLLRRCKVVSKDKLEIEKVIFIYENVIQDMKFAKTQIWNTTYFTVLALSGLIAVSFYLNNQNLGLLYSIYKLILIISVILVGFLGLIAVIFHNMTLDRNIQSLRKEEHLERYRMQDFDEFVDKETEVSRCFFKWLHPVVIVIALIIGVCVIYAL